MMLEFLGHKAAHDAILAAIEKVLAPVARPLEIELGPPRDEELGKVILLVHEIERTPCLPNQRGPGGAPLIGVWLVRARTG